MSDCANGGRHVYQPTYILKIEFDKGSPWVYHLALNGRKIEKVIVGDVVYVPKEKAEEGEFV